MALKVLLIGIAVLIVCFFALCAVIFCLSFVRDREKAIEPEDVRRVREHGDFIRNGVAWLQAQNPEEVEIRSFDGLKLRGLFLPAENAKCTAILMHGYRSGFLWDFAGAYEMLHDHGCNLLVPWQRAHGKSEGKVICMGVKEKTDCADWARYIEKRLGKDLPIVLEGMSMGAATVLMAAGEPLPENVRGIVADCGFSSPWEECAYLLRRRTKLPLHPLLDGVSLCCRLAAGFGLRDCSTEDTLAKSKLPLLLIHGEADHFVPAEFSRKNFAASASEDKKLLLVPGAAHAMSFLADRTRVTKEVLAFYDRVTGKNRPE